APRYEVYDALEAAGILFVVTLRDGPKLAGYYLGLVMPHFHYQNCLTCHTDIFYVLPEYRHGAGRRLFRAVERELKRLGVVRWYVHSKLHKDSGRLFTALGFDAIEQVFSKRLD